MKRVLAISGGVDSMVLLDFCAKKYSHDELLVAHFDHGTRPSSKDDFCFVEKTAKKYGVGFVGKHANLGAGVSEEEARKARYDFLLSNLADNDKLLVAHHLDDLVESVTINFLRGTGMRGLAVMNSRRIERPFLGWAKKDILKYAADNEICFREDPTNASDDYLRNRIRFMVRNLNQETKRKIFDLRNSQIDILRETESIIGEIFKQNIRELENGVWQIPRELFFYLDEEIALELLKFILEQKTVTCTRPQILNFLSAIKKYQPGKKFNLPKNKLIRIEKNYFLI